MAIQSTLSRAAMVGPSSYTALTGARIVSGDSISSTLSRARMVTGGSLIVDAGMAGTFDPFLSLPLLGSVTGGTPDSVTWSLVSSSNAVVTALTLLPAAPAAQSTIYIAPPTVNGVILTWRLTARKAGQADVTDTVVHTIRNHAGPWVRKVGGGYKPVQMTAVYSPDVDVTVDPGGQPYADSYSDTY